jgi:hypothetical protein
LTSHNARFTQLVVIPVRLPASRQPLHITYAPATWPPGSYHDRTLTGKQTRAFRTRQPEGLCRIRACRHASSGLELEWGTGYCGLVRLVLAAGRWSTEVGSPSPTGRLLDRGSTFLQVINPNNQLRLRCLVDEVYVHPGSGNLPGNLAEPARPIFSFEE